MFGHDHGLQRTLPDNLPTMFLPDGEGIPSATPGPVQQVDEAGRLDTLQDPGGLEGNECCETVPVVGKSGRYIYPLWFAVPFHGADIE